MSINLQKHIASLKKAEAAAPVKSDNLLLFLGTAYDKSFLPLLKPCVGAATTYIKLDSISTIKEVELYCKAKGITRVVSTSVPLLGKLLAWDKKKAPSLANYAGSYFLRDGIEYVFIQPLKQLVTVNYGQFMAKRIISKLTRPDSWYKPTTFDWSILDASNEEGQYLKFFIADLICIDIETFKHNAAIRCVAFTAFYLKEGTSRSVVLPIDSDYNLAILRKWCWQLKAPKLFQNGKYDIAYLTRYSAPVYNYLYDTAHLFHSWYSELPKDLGFLNSFFIREAVYWKDLAETNDLHEYYRYNALDTWGTGNCFLAMMQEVPDWAITNYVKEFPLVFPCHLAEMTGIRRDMGKLATAKAEQQEIIATASASLDTMLGVRGFNTNSPKQMKQLLTILGCKDLPNADEKALRKAAIRHPLNTLILDKIITIRKARKLVSTYLTAGKEFIEPSGEATRILYSLNPHGTDTSRLASKSHHFWCGFNIQNQPRGREVKQTLVADPGWLLCEVDLEQAESRDSAYISGDEALIDAVENSPDFHCKNASSFFGIPFDELYDTATGTVLNKPIRQLSKNVNHGATYNMQEYTLIDTMGELKVLKAKSLLNLPKLFSLKEVASYLLAQFHRTYVKIKQVFYVGVIEEVTRTSLLVHHLVGEEGWTRYCFGKPNKNRSDLNSYIAHPPQSLNAQTLNKAWLAVFTQVALPNPKTFKLLAQVHDSILFQYKPGHEYHIQQVKELMEVPVTITGYDNVTRTFTVPADPSKGGTSWADCK